MMKKVLVCVIVTMFPFFSLGGTRYDPQVAPRIAKERQVQKKIFVNVRDMELKKFIPYLAGLTQRRIILEDKEAKEKVSFTGWTTLEALLDVVLPPLGYGWEQDRNGAIRISKYVTKVWKVDIPSVARKLQFSHGSQSSQVSYNYDFQQKLVDSIRSLLTSLVKEGKVTVDPYLGIVTFYGPRKEAKVLEPVISKISDILKDSIKLKIEVIAIRLRREYQTGINLSSVFSGDIKGQVSFSTASTEAPFTAGFTSSKVEGFISALEQYGEVKAIESREFNVVSGFPIVYSSGRKITYLREVRVAYLQVVQGGTTAIPSVNLIQAEENSGTDFILIPRKLENGTLSLDVMFSQKQLDELIEKTFKTEGQETTLQQPQVSYNSFANLAVLKEGEELILVSSVMDLNKDNRKGLPFFIRIPLLRFLFGQNSELSDKVQFVVRVSYEGSLTSTEFLSR